MKSVVPKGPKLREGPEKVTQSPIGWFAFITGSGNRGKDPVQFGLWKVWMVSHFKLNKLKSGIDKARFDPSQVMGPQLIWNLNTSVWYQASLIWREI